MARTIQDPRGSSEMDRFMEDERKRKRLKRQANVSKTNDMRAKARQQARQQAPQQQDAPKIQPPSEEITSKDLLAAGGAMAGKGGGAGSIASNTVTGMGLSKVLGISTGMGAALGAATGVLSNMAKAKQRGREATAKSFREQGTIAKETASEQNKAFRKLMESLQQSISSGGMQIG